jgi:hypothetical protein
MPENRDRAGNAKRRGDSAWAFVVNPWVGKVCNDLALSGARYARHRHAPDSERTLILRSIRAVFWLRFAEAA